MLGYGPAVSIESAPAGRSGTTPGADTAHGVDADFLALPLREVAAAGLVLVDLVEPEWPAGHDRTWGAWSPERGAVIPGTAIFVCVRPA